VHHFNRQNGKTSERVLSPQQLIHYRDNWYLDAWCHLKNELRSFSVDALSQCEILPTHAKEMDADEIRKVMQSGYGIFGGHAYEWVKLKFNSERARWVVNEQWHPEQRGTLKPDGSYQLEVPYSDERELIGDILKFGADVEVLSPKSLRSNLWLHRGLLESIGRYHDDHPYLVLHTLLRCLLFLSTASQQDRFPSAAD
jgi:predicted DNA-binding transcriptional regulator YafY